MSTFCLMGMLALLCLTCMSSLVLAEDNSELRAFDDDNSDGFYRQSRQFYRFGRALSPFLDNEDISLDRIRGLSTYPGYPVTPVLDNDVFSRHSKQFYRFGRAYTPYQDKRFLRFGRSHQADADDISRAVFLQSKSPLYRKRRSPKTESQSDLLNHVEADNQSGDKLVKDLAKRETPTEDDKSRGHLSYNKADNEDEDLDKRFMRFGKRFMRFGRGGDEEDNGYDKRFMRFGKSGQDDQDYEKRFMRFGKSGQDDQDYEKRFMRFGKRFMRFGRGDDEDESDEKRFMRFGKSSDGHERDEKRFMRFGKSFMRFGRGADENANLNYANGDEDTRVGKRSTNESAAELNSENRNNEYLRFGRENNGGYIRFGRNDPFLRFGKKSDPFLRFGRQDPFLRFGRQDPFLRFGREDPFLRFGRNDPYLRFGRSDPFLRFGKSSDAEIESDVDAVTLSREHDIAEENDVSDRRKRSVLTEQVKDSVSKQATTKAVKYGSNVKTMPRKVSEAESGAREIRSGQYMRFGKKNQADVQDDSYDRHFLESEFSRFLRNYSPKISLPRFGKRNEHNIERKQEYMRFGRGSHGI